VRFLVAILALVLAGCAPRSEPRAEATRRPYPLLRKFDLYVATEPRLFIWDTHPVESPDLVRHVCETMQVLGFQWTTTGRADLLVNIQVLARNRDPQDRFLVVEGLEPVNMRRVWLGRTRMTGDAAHPDLAAFLASLEMDSRLAAMERGAADGGALVRKTSDPLR